MKLIDFLEVVNFSTVSSVLVKSEKGGISVLFSSSDMVQQMKDVKLAILDAATTKINYSQSPDSSTIFELEVE